MTMALICFFILAGLIASVDTKIPVFTFNSACDDIQYVYGDGIQEGKHDGWKGTLTSTLQTMSKTIAVSCFNKGGPAGFIGSTPDGRILTNSTWKCSTVYKEGWNKFGFDDSQWSNAVIVDTNNDPTTHGWKNRPEINSNAFWISAAENIPANTTSYCRLNLVFDFVMICDDSSNLYADGELVGSQDGFTKASNVMKIPKMATTFAISCKNKGAYGGLLGSSVDGRLITDKNWKVSPTQVDGWNEPDFDDSQWINAFEVDNNISPQTHGWEAQKKISRDAMWIGGDSSGIPYTRKPFTTHYFRRNIDCLWKETCR